MNYLGHAYLAELEDRDPVFILGAMLPDLVNLAQVRARPPPWARWGAVFNFTMLRIGPFISMNNFAPGKPSSHSYLCGEESAKGRRAH
jgi:hypothetical protein